ncbi:MAG: carbon-nitrogen hydrolase family protein [Geminicoccaceae bacterium]
MRVTAIQTSSIDDKAANLAAVRDLIATAVAADRPDLVLLPEVWAFQGGTAATKREAAEAIPGGEAYRLLQDAAREHRIVLHGGSFLERVGEQLFNTTVVFAKDGGEIARYRKMHLFDVVTPDGREYRESALIGRGAEVVTYDAGEVRVGCTICYDLRFGELYRKLAAQGAELIMVPAAFTVPTGRAHWEVLLRARAIETGCYVAAAAQVGEFRVGSDTRACWGHSMIVDPWGKVLAELADGTGFVTAEVTCAEVERVRGMIPVHKHRVLPG